MPKLRAPHLWLGAIGVTGLMLFILACVPSWSPDGSQVVLTFWDENAETYKVGLYDSGTGTIRTLFTSGVTGASVEHLPFAQWKQDGTAVLVFGEVRDSEDNVASYLLEISPSTGEILRRFARRSDESTQFPAPEYRGAIFIFEKEKLIRLDLNEFVSEDLSCDDCEHTILSSSRRGLLYMRAIPDSDSSGEQLFSVVVGQIDPETGKQYPYFELPMIDADDARSISSITVSRDGTQFAAVAMGEETDNILLCDESGLKRILKPHLAGEYRLGRVEWSPDGEELYASVVRPGSKENNYKWDVAEIAVSSGKTRTFPIVEVKNSSDFFDSFLYYTQIALSPDGKTLAADSATLGSKEIEKSDRALFLVDVSKKDEQRITKIPTPVSEPDPKKKKKN